MAEQNQPALGTRYAFTCPVCGDGNADATLKKNREGAPEWFVGCFSWKCATNRRYLGDLGEALGIGRGASKPELAAAVRATAVQRLGSARREALPSDAKVAGWSAALLSSGDPMAYLTSTRRLSLGVIRSARIGWDQQSLVFPMYHHGRVIAAKRRLPRQGAQMKAWAGRGRPWPLYPEPDPTRGWTLLVAGELDALAARSAGLPASSVTLGAGHWRAQWTDDLRDLVVVVCFDTNEGDAACGRLNGLLDAGVRAALLDLRDLGLYAPKGDLTDYFAAGGSAAALREAARYQTEGGAR